jgi:segregation and condensation protein A
MATAPPFEEGPPRAAEPAAEPTLRVDVDGFEGPLDLLLELARRERVDLARISILALAEQYLAFIEAARRLRLELAADYLVMAAWLAYLKSRLLLPAAPRTEEGPGAEELASALALRLRRLEAVREAARRLADRDQLGRDVFARGAPEAAAPPGARAAGPLVASVHDLVAAYLRQRRATLGARVALPPRRVWSLVEARAALERLIGPTDDWTALDGYLAAYLAEPGRRATVLASALSATLELAREGRIEIHQDRAFAPILIRPAGAP